MFSPEVEGLVDHIMTFEELNALISAAGIDSASLPDQEGLHDASASGRRFPVAGGVAEAIIAQTKAITGDTGAKKSVRDFAETSKWKLPSDYIRER